MVVEVAGESRVGLDKIEEVHERIASGVDRHILTIKNVDPRMSTLLEAPRLILLPPR